MAQAGMHAFTHSVFAIALAVLAFYGIFRLRKQARWLNLGLGLGMGIGLHIALDILLWFSGVQVFWPFGGWLNLWANYRPAEFLFFALYAFWLAVIARKFNAAPRQSTHLRIGGVSLLLLFAIFTPLAYGMQKSFPTLYGLVYLVALGWAFSITIQMRRAIEAAA